MRSHDTALSTSNTSDGNSQQEKYFATILLNCCCILDNANTLEQLVTPAQASTIVRTVFDQLEGRFIAITILKKQLFLTIIDAIVKDRRWEIENVCQLFCWQRIVQYCSKNIGRCKIHR
jgi:hypothetical protein